MQMLQVCYSTSKVITVVLHLLCNSDGRLEVHAKMSLRGCLEDKLWSEG